MAMHMRRDPGHIFALLALLGFYVGWAYVSATTQTYRQYDPEFDYFMTSLAPFKGAPYAYVDHPGTPVEIVGTALMAATLPFVGGTRTAVIDFYLHRPDVFFQMAYAFLILANLGCALFFYSTARSTGRIGALPALALALMFYSMDFSAIGTITYWSHAAFSFPFGTLYLLLLYRALRAAHGELRLRDLIGFGAGAGVLTSIVLYMAPWLVGAVIAVVLFYRLNKVSWTTTLAAAAKILVSALAGFFIAIIPILWKWSTFWEWVTKLAVHEGRFGSGAEGISSLQTLASTLSEFAKRLPLLFIALGVLLVLILVAWVSWRGRLAERPVEWSMVAGLITQSLVLLIIVTRADFYFYLLPLEAVLPVLAFVTLRLVAQNRKLQFVLQMVLVLFVLYEVSTLFYRNAAFREHVAEAIRQDHVSLDQALATVSLKADSPDGGLRIIWGYAVFEQCGVLLDGNYYTGAQFNQELASVCPNQYYLPNGARRAIIANKAVPIEQALRPGWVLIIRESYANYLLDLLPAEVVDVVPSSSSAGGSILIIRQ